MLRMNPSHNRFHNPSALRFENLGRTFHNTYAMCLKSRNPFVCKRFGVFSCFFLQHIRRIAFTSGHNTSLPIRFLLPPRRPS